MTEEVNLWPEDRAARFERYLDALVGVLKRPERARMARVYCRGLLMPLVGKSVEPLAGLDGAAHGTALYQALHHFVADARWDDAAQLAAVAREVLPAMSERHGPIRAWIIDDTGLPKKGRYSVGVAHQYCGQLGKVASCQVAVSLSLANAGASLPVAFRLYLPRAWAEDRARRGGVYVPPEVRYRSKVALALDQLAAAQAQGLPAGVVLADADYGGDAAFRAGVRALGLAFAVAIDRTLSLLPPDGKGPLAAKALARALPAAAWRAVAGRPADLRYAAVRVRAAPHGARSPRRGSWSSGGRMRRSRSGSGWRPSRPQLAWTSWWRSSVCAGTSSGTTWSSNRSSGWAITRGAAGAAFTTTPACVSPPTAFWCASAAFSPLRPGAAMAPATPDRPQRHNPTSIASLRLAPARGLTSRLPRCPCCSRPPATVPPLSEVTQ